MEGVARLAGVLTEGCDAVVLGASSGGLEALLAVLPAFAPGVPYAVVIVLHRPARQASSLPRCLAAACRLPVSEGEDKEPLQPARVYLAPAGYHTLIERERTLALSVDAPVHYSRPSIDVLFASAARVFGARSVGMLLTGANADGAEGLRAVEAAGGLAVVQDPSTAASPEMPLAGLRACRVPLVLALPDIVRAVRMQPEGT